MFLLGLIGYCSVLAVGKQLDFSSECFPQKLIRINFRIAEFGIDNIFGFYQEQHSQIHS